MKMTYIARIQGRMKGHKTIYTTHATSRIIDGSYNSIYKGRSMNFEDLREYVQGDEIRDIDWKASARSQRMLVRQYIAEKKHNIMLVPDTNRRMLANANDTQEKYDVALMTAGTLAYMVSGNGDYVSATYASSEGIKHFPFKTGLMNVERILASYHSEVTMDNHSDIGDALSFIAKNFHRRMIILIVTDMEGVMELEENVVRQLLVLHDILLVNVADVGSSGRGVYNLSEDSYIPEFFTRDRRLARLEREKRAELEKKCGDKLKRLGVSCVVVDTEDNIEQKISNLLGRHRIEKQAKRL